MRDSLSHSLHVGLSFHYPKTSNNGRSMQAVRQASSLGNLASDFLASQQQQPLQHRAPLPSLAGSLFVRLAWLGSALLS
ncbi:hypothetical protein Mapa_005837 [Marchantia paleacea]|nr:hypothetical protein Mapa_005837 [Marchantia paleacea]